ncbi:MAG: hypothetical protein ABSB95_09620 [Dissulfurispiraceae bacterium]|jgi:hypothetical protein
MNIISEGPSAVTVTGDIRTIADYLEIKKILKEMADNGAEAIALKIKDSPSINSALIGFLLRLTHEDKVRLSLQAENDKLYNMLRIMNLIDIFYVTGTVGGRK